MKKKLMMLALSMSLVAATGCSTKSGETSKGSSEVKTKDTVTIAWFPNESGAEMKGAREEIGKVIADAIGKKVEHKTTTDYTI